MRTFEIRSFNHTSFTVPDLDEVLPFLVEGLGFALVSQAPRNSALIARMTGIAGAAVEIAFLRGFGHTIELIEYQGPSDRGAVDFRLCDAGAAHIGLDVTGIEAAVEMARGYGFVSPGEMIAIDAGPNAGRRVVYLRNAAGLTIEFLEIAS